MTEIFDSTDHILILSGYGNPQMHKHQAAHILIALEGTITVVTPQISIECAGALIPSGAEHTIDCHEKPVLVFLFDETTVTAAGIRETVILEKEAVLPIAAEFSKMKNAGADKASYDAFVENTLRRLQLPIGKSRTTDERILSALSFISQNSSSGITCADAAACCYLSESRFSHLFREQTGITFAGYLILRRLDNAYGKIAEGCSITQAAVEAGFADSAHFAAVNKKLFGITASAVGSGLKLYRMTAEI